MFFTWRTFPNARFQRPKTAFVWSKGQNTKSCLRVDQEAAERHHFTSPRVQTSGVKMMLHANATLRRPWTLVDVSSLIPVLSLCQQLSPWQQMTFVLTVIGWIGEVVMKPRGSE